MTPFWERGYRVHRDAEVRTHLAHHASGHRVHQAAIDEDPVPPPHRDQHQWDGAACSGGAIERPLTDRYTLSRLDVGCDDLTGEAQLFEARHGTQ